MMYNGKVIYGSNINLRYKIIYKGEINMKIEKTFENNTLTLIPQGRLDSITSPELESAIEDSIGDATSLVLDMKELEYISSAGLRVLLKAQKMMNNRGKMKVLNVNDTVMEVLEMTGFVDMLTIG